MKKIDISDLKKTVSSLEIDYFLVSSSFEERCFSISNELKDLECKKIIFYNSNEVESIIENSIKLEKLLNSDTEKIELNTDDPVFNYINIYTIIRLWIIKICTQPIS